MLPISELTPELFRPLRRSEYDRLIEIGVFDEDEHVELLRGVLVRMSPQGSPHAWVITRLTEMLTLALHGRAFVRPQLPFAADDYSEPEPDIAVVPIGDYRHAHPSEAHLIIEVSDSSLNKDRRDKLPIYAAARVSEVWIVNLDEDLIEAYSNPFGDTWRSKRCFERGEQITVGAFPDVQIAVEEILP